MNALISKTLREGLVPQSRNWILDTRSFEAYLENGTRNNGKTVTRLRGADLHESDIARLRFAKTTRRNGKNALRTELSITIFVRGIHGPLLFCLVNVENPNREKTNGIGNCTIRLPIVGNRDGGILWRRAFDNLVREMSHVLTPEEQSLMTEEFLDDIVLIPNYRERLSRLWKKIKELITGIF